MHLPPSILAGLLSLLFSPRPSLLSPSRAAARPLRRGGARLKPGEESGEALKVIRRLLRCSCLLIACFGLLTASASALALAGELDSDWSARLMLEQASIERAQARLDRARAAYARAVLDGEATGPARRTIEELGREREEAEAALRERERSLPALVEEARRAGVSPEVLEPYRFAVSPADSP